MNKILLVTRPKYDDATEYLAFYAGLIIKQAKDKNIDCKDFKGETANSKNIIKFIHKKDPSLCFINGHGTETFLYGHKDEIIFDNKNYKILNNRIIYARACDAGALLGKRIVEENDGCFIGYQWPFSFIIDSKWSTKPHNDKVAALFLEPSNLVINSLLKGDETNEANAKSRSRILENIKEVMKMKDKEDSEKLVLIKYLYLNYEGQVIHGNKSLVF